MINKLDGQDAINVTTSKGNQIKYKKENIWYKGDYLGFEGAAESVVSRLVLKNCLLPHLIYTPCKFYVGKKLETGCSSPDMLQDDEELVTAYKLIEKEKGINIAKYLTGHETSEKIHIFVNMISDITNIDADTIIFYLTGLLELDAATFNDDRHFNNICFIRDKDGKYRFSPIFDNGGAFLSDMYTYGEPGSMDSYNTVIKAKPFDTDIDIELDAMELMNHGQAIQLYIPEEKEIYDLLVDYYPAPVIEQINTLLRETFRKYNYLYADTPKDIPDCFQNDSLYRPLD